MVLKPTEPGEAELSNLISSEDLILEYLNLVNLKRLYETILFVRFQHS